MYNEKDTAEPTAALILLQTTSLFKMMAWTPASTWTTGPVKLAAQAQYSSGYSEMEPSHRYLVDTRTELADHTAEYCCIQKNLRMLSLIAVEMAKP